MIQRIQTVYFLITAVLIGLMFFFPLATFMGDGSEFRLTACSFDDITDPANPVRYMHTIYLSILLGAAALLPLVIMFLYKRRLLQIRLCFAEIVLLLGALGFVAYYIYHYSATMEVFEMSSWKVGLPAVFPLVSIILMVLALRAVLRDENLIRSLNRIR